MSCNSLKSVLDAEFSEMVTEKKKKVSKMSKVAEVRRVHQRHGLKKQRQTLLKERRLASAPRKGGQTPYFSHSLEPVTAEEDARLEAEKRSRLAEENAKALLSLSAISRSRSTAGINEHQLSGKRSYTPKCHSIVDKVMGKHNNAKLKKKSQESSVFTDQDFENFSKEYFGFSDPINKKTSEKKKKKQEDDEYL